MFRWLKRLFGYEISLNRVHDRFTVREGNERIEIRVDSDPRLMVTRIRNANEKILEAQKDGTDEDREQAARIFAEAIMCKEQTDRLLAFYNGDYSCMMTVCGLYFEKRLSAKITKAQKKLK